jgi:hypothetical protein
VTTYSLEESSVRICGGDGNNNHVPAQVQWVMRRLRRGEFSGYKVGRRWRMTEADIEAAIETLRPKRAYVPEVPQLSGLTRTSARRLSA